MNAHEGKNEGLLHLDWLLLQYGDDCKVIATSNGEHPAVSGGEYIGYCAVTECRMTDCPLYRGNGRPEL